MTTLAQAIQRKAKKRQRIERRRRKAARPPSEAVKWDGDFFSEYVRQHLVRSVLVTGNDGK